MRLANATSGMLTASNATMKSIRGMARTVRG